MTKWDPAKHPRQRLSFHIDQDFEQDDDDTIGKKIRSFVESLANTRSWMIHPPEFSDSDLDPGFDGTSPERTLGGHIDIYSALPGTNLPREVDRQVLEEVEFLVESIRKFSQAEELIISFNLDRTYVGTIEDGMMDESLKIGLLGEWKRFLDGLE